MGVGKSRVELPPNYLVRGLSLFTFKIGKSSFLRRLWLGVALICASAVLVALNTAEPPSKDVLGFAAGEGPSVAEVVALNQQVLHTDYLHVGTTPDMPDPLLPDLVAHAPSDLGLVGSKEENNLRLKFTTRFSNAGEGPLEVRAENGSENTQGESERLVQVLYTRDADEPDIQPIVGRYALEQAHGHLHLESFARYELWSVGEQGELVESLVSNPKVGFCLIDAEAVDPEVTPVESRVYWGCRSEVQGLSVGWGDLYAAQLAVQDLNVSALPDGRYALLNIINHGETLIEGDYTNNRAEALLRLEDGTLTVE